MAYIPFISAPYRKPYSPLFLFFVRLMFRLYPPFLGSGIKVTYIDPKLREIRVRMKSSFLNRNYHGTFFGGSLYAMCDPFLLYMLTKRLGPEFIVWDIESKITFKKADNGIAIVSFKIADEEFETLRHQTLNSRKIEPTFTIKIKNEKDEILAIVEKKLYLRKKPARMLA